MTYLNSGVMEIDRFPNSVMVSGFNRYVIPNNRNTAAACTYLDFSHDDGDDNDDAIDAAMDVLPLVLRKKTRYFSLVMYSCLVRL